MNRILALSKPVLSIAILVCVSSTVGGCATNSGGGYNDNAMYPSQDGGVVNFGFFTWSDSRTDQYRPIVVVKKSLDVTVTTGGRLGNAYRGNYDSNYGRQNKAEYERWGNKGGNNCH